MSVTTICDVSDNLITGILTFFGNQNQITRHLSCISRRFHRLVNDNLQLQQFLCNSGNCSRMKVDISYRVREPFDRMYTQKMELLDKSRLVARVANYAKYARKCHQLLFQNAFSQNSPLDSIFGNYELSHMNFILNTSAIHTIYIEDHNYIKYFAELLRTNRTIRNIYLSLNHSLSDNDLFNRELRDMIGILGNNPMIHTFHISGVYMRSETVRQYTEIIKRNTTIRDIHFNVQHCADNYYFIFRAIAMNSAIERISLAYNRIGNNGACQIANILRVRNSPIREINLHNCGIGDNGACIIANALVENTTLRKMDLSSNEIRERDSGEYILRELERNTGLEFFNLKMNPLYEKNVDFRDRVIVLQRRMRMLIRNHNI